MPTLLMERLRRWRRRATTRAAVLRYHRVADLAADPFDLAVSPSRFAEHLDVLAARGTVIPLEDLVNGLRANQLPDRALAITFDDGYRETVTSVAASLRTHRLPATVFIVTDHLTDGREFWWDTLERVLLETVELPDRLGPEVAGPALALSLGAAARRPEPPARGWTWRDPGFPTPRHRLLVTLHRLLKGAKPTERTRLLARLVEWAGADPATSDARRTATAADLVALRNDASVRFGAHSKSHPDLGTIADAERDGEIAGAKETLDAILGRPTTMFAYPFGRTAGRGLVRQAGYLAGCGTTDEPLTPRADPFRLPRLAVANWTGEEFDRRLRALGL